MMRDSMEMLLATIRAFIHFIFIFEITLACSEIADPTAENTDSIAEPLYVLISEVFELKVGLAITSLISCCCCALF